MKRARRLAVAGVLICAGSGVALGLAVGVAGATSPAGATTPVGTGPVGTGPVGTGPVGTGPVETTPPTEPPRPVSELPAPQPLEASTGRLPPLIPIPAGCPTPPQPTAVFVGRLVTNSSTAARFEVQQIRAGSLKDFMSGRLVDVMYVQETRFLHAGQQYLVGVGSSKGRLVSKVRASEPKFGGSAVISVNDTDTPCPPIEDPIRTLQFDGQPVESGVFAEITGNKLRLAQVALLPLFIGMAVLAGLALLKDTVGATGRGLRGLMDRESAAMRRADVATRPPQHRPRRP